MKKYFLLFIFIILATLCGAVVGLIFQGAPLIGAIYLTFMWMAYLWYVPLILSIYSLVSVAIYAVFEKIVQKEMVRKVAYYALIFIPTILIFLLFLLSRVGRF